MSFILACASQNRLLLSPGRMSNKSEETKIPGGLIAVVTGATGAIGREVVGELLCSKLNWAKVVTLGRRPVVVPEGYNIDQKNEEEKGRLVQHVGVDMEDKEALAKLMEGASYHFCCLGTTKSDAGSAAAFRKIDFEFVVNIATAAKASGTSHFSLVSSTGANANSWFLYMKTKGEVENAVKSLGFPYTAIYQPGLLDRGGKVRTGEKIGRLFMKSMPVATVARAMRAQTEQDAQGKPAEKPQVCVFGNAQIFGLAK